MKVAWPIESQLSQFVRKRPAECLLDRAKVSYALNCTTCTMRFRPLVVVAEVVAPMLQA